MKEKRGAGEMIFLNIDISDKNDKIIIYVVIPQREVWI
jgi:hypothetical protein